MSMSLKIKYQKESLCRKMYSIMTYILMNNVLLCFKISAAIHRDYVGVCECVLNLKGY